MAPASDADVEAAALSFHNERDAESREDNYAATSLTSARQPERFTGTVDAPSSREKILFPNTPIAGSTTPWHTFEHASTVDGAISFLFDLQRENGLLLDQEEDIADHGLDAGPQFHSSIQANSFLSDLRRENGLMLEQEEDVANAGPYASFRPHSCVHMREVLNDYDTCPLLPLVARSQTQALGAVEGHEDDDDDDLPELLPISPSSSSTKGPRSSN
ncbi:hypothetical protein DL93DRAFT_290462 [Clavulina sp. PMI_390]|nr:hypothetical protein DL93DRAFT_290462 [Clavulina sp. PMI_390]